jgi:hypothetical protein
MHPSKHFKPSRSRSKPFDHAVDLVWFARGLADLRNEDVGVEAFKRPCQGAGLLFWDGREFVSYQAVLLCDRFYNNLSRLELKKAHLGMIDPMACPSSPNELLQLGSLDPDNLVDSLVAPGAEAIPPNFHRSTSHPKKKQAARVLQLWERQGFHFVVREGPTVR